MRRLNGFAELPVAALFPTAGMTSVRRDVRDMGEESGRIRGSPIWSPVMRFRRVGVIGRSSSIGVKNAVSEATGRTGALRSGAVTCRQLEDLLRTIGVTPRIAHGMLRLVSFAPEGHFWCAVPGWGHSDCL